MRADGKRGETLCQHRLPAQAEMTFKWQVPVGRLIGKSREVTWDLSGVPAGTYTATVEASDRHKHTANGSITVTVVICPGWRVNPPPCPILLGKLSQ